MKNKFRFNWSIAAVMLVATQVALAAPKDENATVGWFLKEIATARGLSAPTEAGAAQVLKAAGFTVPSLDPAKKLTEGDAVAIGSSVGFSTTTQTPGAPFTRTRAQAFLSAYRTEIGVAGDEQNASRGDDDGNGPPFDPKGKGKKKGHNKSPSEPL